jgi:predicted acetyltransferase
VRLDQRPLADGDLDQMWEIEREAFNADPAIAERWRGWVRAVGAERYEGVLVDGRLVAMAGALPFGQWFGGRSVPMGGLSAVAVRPEHRGRGYGARVIRATLDAMQARGEAISCLFPAVARPYRTFGWEMAGVLTYRAVPARALRAISASEVLVRRASVADLATVRACYTRVARETNGFVDRGDGRWQWIADQLADDFLFVAGEEGYVLYRHDKPPPELESFRVLVRELVATTPAALRALWGMLGAASSVVPTVTFRGGPNDTLALLLGAPDVVVVRERVWMLRLVEAAAAIAARGYPSGVRVSIPLEIIDAQCPRNAGRFMLVVEEGRGRLEPGGGGAIRVGIGALSALFTGYAGSAMLGRAGLLDGGTAVERAALDLAFAGPTPWMVDEF